MRDGKLDRIRESTRQGLYITLYVDGRYSSNSTSDLRDEAVADYVRQVVEGTRYLARDEHRHRALQQIQQEADDSPRPTEHAANVRRTDVS